MCTVAPRRSLHRGAGRGLRGVKGQRARYMIYRGICWFHFELTSCFSTAGYVRPVVLLGPIADICRDKLMVEYPEKFTSPGKLGFFVLCPL